MNDHSGHAAHYKKRLINSLFIGLPILFIAPMMDIELFFQFTFMYSEWVTLVLATILFFYGGKPFFAGALEEFKAKEPAMMMLVTLGISVAYFYSVYAIIANEILMIDDKVMDFFFELASLILIMLLGHYLEMRALASAGDALDKIAKLLPDTATLIKDNHEEKVQLNQVKKGDIVVVKAGESIPIDGEIIEGKSSINESLVTGESKAVEKKVGDEVIGGSINDYGTIQIEVTALSDEGYLSKIMDLVQSAEAEKSNVETLADKVAKYLFYIALITAIIALIYWTLDTDLSLGVERMVTVLVIACPHALGLAIPLVISRSTALAAQHGLLIKSKDALQLANEIDVMMLDKTGTLTEGNFEVIKVVSNNDDYSEAEVLKYIYTLEKSSSHPIALSIIDYAKEQEVEAYESSNHENISGVGLKANVDDQEIMIVNVKYLKDNNIEYKQETYDELVQDGYTISYLLIDNKNKGLIVLGDEVKDDAKDLIKALRDLNIETIMLTGDNESAAKVVAESLKLDKYYGSLLPADKERIVREYQDKGFKVAMVGDGVNDAPSLVRADVGIAIGAGIDVAIDSAEIILVKSQPKDIVQLLTLAKNTQRKMNENLIWGAGYNFIAIPLAAGILAGIGFILSPAIGAILMSLSTIIVAINAILLKVE